MSIPRSPKSAPTCHGSPLISTSLPGSVCARTTGYPVARFSPSARDTSSIALPTPCASPPNPCCAVPPHWEPSTAGCEPSSVPPRPSPQPPTSSPASSIICSRRELHTAKPFSLLTTSSTSAASSLASDVRPIPSVYNSSRSLPSRQFLRSGLHSSPDVTPTRESQRLRLN